MQFRRRDPHYWIEQGLLPPSAQEIAEVIGREKTLRLIGSLPRTMTRPWRVCFYVPKVMPLDHWLVVLLGVRDAERMRYEFGGMILQPSSCSHLWRMHRNRGVHTMAAQGYTQAQLAECFELSDKHIRAILAENPPEEIEPIVPDHGGNAIGGRDGDMGELVGQGRAHG